MDPAVVDSAQFGLLWKIPFNAQEQFYAKPLVYTPASTGVQIVFLASSQNYIRTLNAKTGELLLTRQVQTPFLQSDIGCTDIPNTIGIIGTPVIDPNTDIAYFYAKTYIPNFRTAGNTGTFNGVYYFYAVYVKTLQDVPGYPVLVDGSYADNDPRKYFVGGTILQRPSLSKIGNVVYAAVGGHCDLFNYTGTVLGVDVTTQKVVTNFVTESGPNSRFSTDWLPNGGGGQAGIWQSGMGLASDGNRMFFVTGNGNGGENQDLPANGASGCRTLAEAVVNLGVDPTTGKVSAIDYFQPYDYVNMDGGDQDFGSGGIALLDPTVFKGTGVSRIGVTSGKNGKIYILNADNLGGYKQGPGQTDLVLQTITTNHAVFGGVGSYPLEGGYIYSTPVGYPTSAYKLGFNGAGQPVFTFAGATPEVSAGRVGGGVPTITTFKGQPGTAILWLTDPDAGLRAWYAVPQNGVMVRINLPQTGGINKFQRPAFGDTRMYVTDANGVLYCLGSPVNLPLKCNSPVSFGDVALNSTATATLSCTAIIGINAITQLTVGDARFVVDKSTIPQGAIAAGKTFSFNVTWDLRNVAVNNAANASYGNTSPGIKSTALTLYTTNSVGGYATSFPLGLTGNQVSRAAYLGLTPITNDFGGLVLGIAGETPSSTLQFTIANLGLTPMTILGYAYTYDEVSNKTGQYFNATNNGGIWDLGTGFASTDLPPVGSIIQAGGAISVPATFTASTGTGDYLSYFFVYSDGGKANTILEGSASTAPKANFSISNGEGGWLGQSNLLMDFGSAKPGETVSRQIRICNEGGSVLTVSKSKPPLGAIRAQNYGIDLHESQTIAVNDCAYGTVIFGPGAEPPNIPDFTETNTWTLNTDDLSWGVHVVQMTGVVHDKVFGPTYTNGSARYQYLGCYLDSATGTRLLPQQVYADTQNNENGKCQTACAAQGYAFAGTEYQQECWCGNKLPSGTYYNEESQGKCTFSCPGDLNQACGGNGGTGYISIYYDTTKYSTNNNTYLASSTGTNVAASGPVTRSSVDNYNYIGCYSEASAGRALSGKAVVASPDGGSVEWCSAGCTGYSYFGVEYGNECYCGNTLMGGSALVAGADVASTGCSMTCGANSSEYCGGPNRLNVYQLNGSAPVTTTSGVTTAPTANPSGPAIVQSAGLFHYLGCYNDSVQSRALSVEPIAGNTMTVQNCANACSSYAYFGIEYATECYCGNSLLSYSQPMADGCSMTCGGDSSSLCGGPNRLTMYIKGNGTLAASVTTSGTAPDQTTAVASSTAAATPTGPVTVQTAGSFISIGCYNDTVGSRAFSVEPAAGNTMTIKLCAAACASYAYFGVEYGVECYCGNQIASRSVNMATGCSMACGGNSSELCGGPNRLNAYQNSNIAVMSSTVSGSSVPTTTVSSSTSSSAAPTRAPVQGSQYAGCWTDSTGLRVLTGGGTVGNAASPMSLEVCGAYCSGFVYWGVEYGQE